MRKKILITVKTYPVISKKYQETVCTAGLREDGSWIRLYPVPFRTMDDCKKFRKYQWLTATLTARPKDQRPESYSPDRDSIEAGPIIDRSNQWNERCRWVLEKGTVHDNMTDLIRLAKVENKLSLATYKPKEIIDLIHEPTDREWSENLQK